MASLALFTLAAGLSGGLAADTVELANGNRFEPVVAEVDGDTVRIRFSYGEMSVPRSTVTRVVQSESALDRYLAEADRLGRDPESTAGDWLELALTARADGLDGAYRRAVALAAELDPWFEPLAPHLRALDLVLDETAGRWVPYREPAPPASPAGRVGNEIRDERGRLLATLELLALAELAEELRERARTPPPVIVAVPPTVTFLGAVAPFGWRPTESNRETMRQLVRRQPGSLLPVIPRQQNRSGFKRAEGF